MPPTIAIKSKSVNSTPVLLINKQPLHTIQIYDFEISADNMESIKLLDTKTTLFFDNRNPDMIIRMANRKLDL